MSQLEEIQQLQIADEHDTISGTLSLEQNNKDGTTSTEQNNKDGTTSTEQNNKDGTTLSTEQNSTTEESTPSEHTDKNSVLGQLETNSSIDNKTETSHSERVTSGSDEECKTERRKLKREDLKLPKDFQSKLAFLIYDVFTKEECKEYIRKTEEMGYEMALVNVGGGRQMKMTDVRNSSRCIWDSVEEANKIWERIKEHIPDIFKNRTVQGLNERLRFLRYDPGEYFKPHMDGQYRRKNGERSHLTIQLYLNEGFKGGSTTFMGYNLKDQNEVVPKTGMILVFEHDIMHEGSTLLKGRKYSMRTDVMYSAQTL